MGDPYSYIREGEDIVCSSMKVLAGVLAHRVYSNAYTGHWPSLLQGSAQRVYVAGFKKDPADKSTSMSILIVRSCNAD